ncbi:conserved protein of unknown function [Burkholderia multivorans]
MRRIYVLLPSVEVAKAVVDELLVKRIEWRHIHVVANDKVPLQDLPQASIKQSSDLLLALARGGTAGGVTGMLAGLAALAFPPVGLTIAGGAVLVFAAAGASFGAWVGAMIGISVPSPRLKHFKDAVERGELLMLVDVPKDRVDEIGDLIKLHHPQSHIEGTDPTIPAFP